MSYKRVTYASKTIFTRSNQNSTDEDLENQENQNVSNVIREYVDVIKNNETSSADILSMSIDRSAKKRRRYLTDTALVRTTMYSLNL